MKAKVKTQTGKSKAPVAAKAKVQAPVAAKPTVQAPVAKPKVPAAKPEFGRAVALKAPGAMTGPFTLTPAARAAGNPVALHLKKDSARWKIMVYAYAHPAERLTRERLGKLVGPAQVGAALSGALRYRFLKAV